MAIQISRLHHTDLATARTRVEALAEQLADDLKVQYAWKGNRLVFERVGANGHIAVDDVEVHVFVAKNPFLPVSEAWLREQVEHHLDAHLSPVRPARPAPENASIHTPPPPDPNTPPEPPRPRRPQHLTLVDRLATLAGGLTTTAARLTAESAQVPLKVAEALLLDRKTREGVPDEQRQRMRDTGRHLRMLRTQAGYSLAQLSDSLDLDDEALLDAIEQGEAIPSFPLMLGLAAHLTFEEPIPFLIMLGQTYHPEVWALLETWGIGELPLHSTRERRLVELYRRYDAADALTDAAFEEVLSLTRAAFEMGIRFGEQKEEGNE